MINTADIMQYQLEAATQGEWEIEDGIDVYTSANGALILDGTGIAGIEANATHITAMHNREPEVIALVRAAEEITEAVAPAFQVRALHDALVALTAKVEQSK